MGTLRSCRSLLVDDGGSSARDAPIGDPESEPAGPASARTPAESGSTAQAGDPSDRIRPSAGFPIVAARRPSPRRSSEVGATAHSVTGTGIKNHSSFYGDT